MFGKNSPENEGDPGSINNVDPETGETYWSKLQRLSSNSSPTSTSESDWSPAPEAVTPEPENYETPSGDFGSGGTAGNLYSEAKPQSESDQTPEENPDKAN